MAVVQTPLLYGWEIWTLYSKQLNVLDHFHLRCLQKITGLSWIDRVPNNEVLRRSKTSDIESDIMKSQLRWVGSVVCMDTSRLPKVIFFSELVSGTRNTGGPVKRYNDCLKASPRNSGVNYNKSPIPGVRPCTTSSTPLRRRVCRT